MRKILTVLMLLILLMTMVLGASVTASASSEILDDYNIPSDVPIINGNSILAYSLVNTDGDGIGFKFVGGYFGSAYSNITLSVSIYDAASYNSSNSYVNDSTIMSLMGDIHTTVNYIDTLANTQYTESDVYLFNMAESGETVAISDMTAQMIMYAQSMYDITDGAYNPAVYRLVDLWGFSSRVYNNYDYVATYDYDRSYYWRETPDEKYITAFMDLCDFSQVELGGSAGSYTLTKNCQDVVVDGVSYSQWIDLGGIAKGYAVEIVADIIESYGYEHYFIDSGGSSMCFTSYEDGSEFSIGLSEPIQYNWLNKTYATLSVSNTTLSTSGLYNRCYTIDDVTYSHIVDATTGYPVATNIQTITVVGGTAWANDCLTTAFTVMGAEEIADFVNNDGLFEVAELENISFVAEEEDNIASSVAYTGISGMYLIGLQSYDDDGNLGILASIDITELDNVNTSYPIVSQMTESGMTLVVPDLSDYTWLIVLACVVGVVIIGVLLYIRYHHPKEAMSNVNNVRKGRLFVLSDIAVYAVLLVLIVSLLWVFVFTVEEEPYSTLQIVDTLYDEVIFVYNAETGEYVVNYSDRLDVVVVDCDDGCICVYILLEGETDLDNFINLLCIEPDGTADMVDAVCGLYEDCVNTFPAITSAGGVIVCSPNNIKVVAIGGDS